MADQEQRQHMLACEARYWLRRGFTTSERVAELEQILVKKRGFVGVARLVDEMRRQWGARRDWLRREQ